MHAPLKTADTMEGMYEGISLKPADNGGFVLSFHTYTPALKNDHGRYKDHTETFTEQEEDKAMDRLIALHKENITHYKKSMGKKNSSHKSSH